MTRLDCLLANRGYCYRSRTGDFLHAHEVTLDGQRQANPSKRVDESRVIIAGQAIDPECLWILLHKPTGHICSHKEHGQLIYELMPERWLRRKPVITSVGRLDKDTTGLLVVTDDGPLVHWLTSPKHHVPRVYLATVQNAFEGHEPALFASGTLMIEDDDKPLLPASMEILGKTQARLTLHEGRYHQVRRMFEAIGNVVTALHRESFGTLTLQGLDPGQFRLLTADEIARLQREQP
jgi:16S rRNA pseudouridine516 synthase